MGLKGGDHGSKTTFQDEFPDSFLPCPRLEDARELTGVDRSETLVVLDGNVMVMAVPQAMTTFNEYVMILVAQIKPAITAAAHVVVVFDEPKAMTRAKSDEQRLRDARRKATTPICSDELVACITTDDFTLEMLQLEGCNVRLLMNHRAARSRFIDALCNDVLYHFQIAGGADSWSLTFDGVDGRGAGREFGERRVAGILSTHQEFWSALLTREVAIGEGDIKLTDVAQRVHDEALKPDSPVAGVVLNMLVTVDTDSLVIELLKQSKRVARTDEADRNELTILCLKEPGRKRKGDDFFTPTRFLCCNIARFYDDVCEYLSPPNDSFKPAAVALLVAALACCGCDFLEVKGARADLMLPVVKALVKKKPEMLKDMACVFEKDAVDVLRAKSAVTLALDAYADSISTMPRMGRAHASASNFCDAQVLRALWVVSYWTGREFRDCSTWGFASASVS